MKPRIQDGPGPTEAAHPALNQPSSLNRQVRNWLRQTKALRWLDRNDAILSFKDLYVKESRQLGDEVDAKAVSVVTGTAGEPWVAFTPKDRFGLALSGGGIRSATFNLGLLQALAQLGVLRQVNYLSTVSGGGYVGGFWTAWLRRCGDRAGEDRFPLDHERRGCEQAEVRHLREFSRFLLPRAGVLETEFWGIAMTILGGLIPSLLAALAVLVIGWYFWALLLASLTMESFWSARVMGVSLLVYLVGAEFWWGRSGKSEHNERETWGYCAGCGIGLTLAFIGWAVRERWLPGAEFDPSVALLEPSVSFAPSVLLGVCTLALLVVRLLMARFYRTPTGISVLVGAERALTRFLGLTSTVTVLAALWVVAGLMADAAHGWGLQITAAGAALSAALFAWAKKWLTSPPQETHGGNLFSTALKWLKRATPKLLAGLVWLLLFLLVGAAVQAWGIRYAGLYSWPFWSLLGGSLGIVGLAAWLFDPARVGMHEFYRSRISRCYLGASNFDGTRAQPEHERAASNRFTNERPGDDLTLKELPGSPFLSTHEVKASALAKRLREQNDAVSRFLWNELSAHTRKHLAAGSDPGLESESINPRLVEELNRILGASSMYEAQRFAQASLSEATRRLIERNVALDPDERVRLNRLLLEDAFPEEIARNQPLPLHLVCVAANDMSGDRLGTLYRGARSAVLSVNGISLGDDTAKLDDLRFSAALTASAAAFNSQMGRISIDLGPAVTFLMSALNLRLGLWVPHPSNRRRGDYWFPGRFFLFELLGRSRTTKKHLHLSDGDHFENFGLYELIRRHCRYIIVSDCGADPEVAFDDLANVLRRVREDFGVEIELDVSPLRPGNDGLARQHAVVGTIHYNSPRGMDKGTILFFKPALTGDEPADVLQYRTRNRSFPHETTSDQFYDEAQWESYRRLGEHVGHVVLDFFEQLNVRKRNLTDRLFRDARSFWHPAPPHQHEDFLNLTDRCASLEADLTANGPSRLRNEFFAEAVELAAAGASTPASSGRERPADLPDPNLDEELRSLAVLLRVLQIMEDVWLAADLDHYWSHPLNQGWMNYFQRWASTPSFRRWWPILGPIYSPGFREFAKARFAVGVRDAQAKAHGPSFAAAGLELREIQDRAPFLASNLWLQFKQRRPAPDLSGRSILAYELELLDYNGNPGGVKLQVGFVLVEELRESDAWIAKWKAEEFFVPPAMHGVGIVSHLLDAVVRHFQTASRQQPRRSFSELRVQFGTTPTGQPPAEQKPRAAGRAARLERVREIEFYKSRGFRYVYQEDPKTGAITLSRDLQPQE